MSSIRYSVEKYADPMYTWVDQEGIYVTLDDITADFNGEHLATMDYSAETYAELYYTWSRRPDTVEVALDDTAATFEGVVAAVDAGDIAVLLEDSLVSTAGVHGVSSSVAVMLDDTQATFSAEFGEDVVGTIEALLSDTVAAVQAVHGVAGDIAATLDSTTAALQGAQSVAGVIGADLADTVAALDAHFGPPADGEISVTLDDTTSDVSGAVGVVATLATSIGDLDLSIVAAHGVVGSVTADLDDTVSSFQGTFEDVTAFGSMDVGLDDTTAAFDGTVADAVHGTILAVLDSVAVTVGGVHGVAGVLSDALEDVRATLTFTPPSLGLPNRPGVVAIRRRAGADVTSVSALPAIRVISGPPGVTRIP